MGAGWDSPEHPGKDPPASQDPPKPLQYLIGGHWGGQVRGQGGRGEHPAGGQPVGRRVEPAGWGVRAGGATASSPHPTGAWGAPGHPPVLQRCRGVISQGHGALMEGGEGSVLPCSPPKPPQIPVPPPLTVSPSRAQALPLDTNLPWLCRFFCPPSANLQSRGSGGAVGGVSVLPGSPPAPPESLPRTPPSSAHLAPPGGF